METDNSLNVLFDKGSVRQPVEIIMGEIATGAYIYKAQLKAMLAVLSM